MSALDDLKPTKKLRVIDLVKEAGVDVRDWSHFKGGKRRAPVNPKYCYEWSFIQSSELLVLNCWYDDVRTVGDKLVIDIGMREWARRNAERGGKPIWSKRAWKFDEALQTALRDGLPIRVILCDGKKRRADDPAAKASTVERRKLDSARWVLSSYDYKTGKGQLTRGVHAAISRAPGISHVEIKTALLRIAKLVSKELKQDFRTAELLGPRDRRARLVDTGGYAISVGRLTPAVSVEVWLDYCAGLPTPRVWVGFCSSSQKAIEQLLKTGTLDGMARHLLRISSSRVTTQPYFHITDGLRPDAFTRLVREDYGPHYLGVYYSYEWPFSNPVLGNLCKEAHNFIATVCEGNTSLKREARGRLAWTPPDPAVERAAVRHVARYLTKSGYLVTSREKEPVGYDLHAVRGAEELHVEVKGCGRDRARFFVSRNEIATAKRDASWRLAVVTRALRRPTEPRFLTHAQVGRTFELEPTEWEGRPRV